MVIESNLHQGHGIVRGNIFSLRRTITGLPSGITVSGAELTVKTSTSDADPGIFQKTITSSNVAGTGQIEDTGSTGAAVLRFDLGSADTLAMVANTEYYYDINITMSDASLVTVESGRTSARERVAS